MHTPRIPFLTPSASFPLFIWTSSFYGRGKFAPSTPPFLSSVEQYCISNIWTFSASPYLSLDRSTSNSQAATVGSSKVGAIMILPLSLECCNPWTLHDQADSQLFLMTASGRESRGAAQADLVISQKDLSVKPFSCCLDRFSAVAPDKNLKWLALLQFANPLLVVK